MGKFDKILDDLQKSASDRDAGTAKQKCPLCKKPAIYVAVARGDTGDPVDGIAVDISKPTTKNQKTNSEGEVKVDPAKLGSHVVKVVLTKDQEKKYAGPPAQAVTTSKARTSIVAFILEPLPKLRVEVKDKEGNKPVDGVRVEAGRLPELTTSGGKADFGTIPAGKYRVIVTVPKPLETRVEVSYRGAVLEVFEPGYPAAWLAELPYGDEKIYQVVISKVRWIEFILAEQGTDKPIAEAKLHAKLPGGGKVMVLTNHVGRARITYAQDGKVEIERIELKELGSVVKVETR